MNTNDSRLEMKILSYMSLNIDSLTQEKWVELLYDDLKIYSDGKISKQDIQSSFNSLNTKGLLHRDDKNEEICIDTRGLAYIFEEQYNRVENIERGLNYRIDEFNEKIVSIDNKIDESNRIIDAMNDKIGEFNGKIVTMDKKIDKFDTNIISIMTLLIAAFSIIGFNISGIKFIASNNGNMPIIEYVLSIIVINFSIVSSLYFVFFLVNRILNKHSDSKAWSTFGIYGVLIVSSPAIVIVVLLVAILFKFK